MAELENERTYGYPLHIDDGELRCEESSDEVRGQLKCRRVLHHSRSGKSAQRGVELALYGKSPLRYA